VVGAYGSQPYHLHVPIVLKSGSIKLLEPSGPVQACYGLALALHICLTQIHLDVNYILYFFLDNVSSKCFGCYLHPSSGAQLQHTAIGGVWFGVFFHWSRYWFGTPLHLNTISYRLYLTVPKPVPAPMDFFNLLNHQSG
jgi:hypothetical protein